jgi:hypothetical protein
MGADRLEITPEDHSSRSPRSSRPLRGAGLALLALLGSAAAVHAEHRVRTVSAGYLPSGAVSNDSDSQASPDGRWIVFVACDDESLCWLASSRRFAAAGEEPVTLDGPVYGFSFFSLGIDFTISADSRRVVYDARTEEDAENDLWSVEIDGSSAPVRLNAPLLAEESIDDYELTADGQQVVFELNRQGTDLLVRAPIDGSSGPTTLDEGDDIRFYLFPAASGNPRLLYFIDTDDNNQLEILTIYLSSNLPFPLWAGQLRAGTFITSLEFTPDGVQAVLRADIATDEVDELWSIRCDSANTFHRLNQALVSGGNVLDFELSSDGRAVYQADAQVDERFELWSAPIDASAAPVKLSGTLVAGGDIRNLRVAGTWAVYIADATVDERDELWSVPADGHEAPTRRSDTVPPGRDVSTFRFTPSGTRLVYRANLGPVDRYDLHTTTAFGITSHVQLTNRNPLAPSPYSVRAYVLSPDSQRVAFTVTPDANWNGVAMEQRLSNPQTTAETLIEVSGGDEADYSVSYLPDSRGLLTEAILETGDRRESLLIDQAIFADGFGSGDRTAWSASVP